MRELQTELQSRVVRINEQLQLVLERYCAEAPATLREAITYSLFAPGKRLRPLLVVLACEAAGGTEAQAVPAACALEMLHTYSLIHDDLPAMDDDDLRRGLPTCHKKYGEALAILAGDALLTLAFQVLADSYPPQTAAVSCAELARGAGACGMVGGQVLDLTADGRIQGVRPSQDRQGLENIHLRKTGALYKCSLRLGLYAAQGELATGPDPVLLGKFDEFARCFGLAFQIADDLLDVEGRAEITGKTIGKDAARGKLTFPGLFGVDESLRLRDDLYRKAIESLAGIGSAGNALKELVHRVMNRVR